MGNNGEFVYERWEITNSLGLIQKCNDKKSSPPYTFFINNEFELIEEQQDIDIQAIEDINIRPYKGFTDICNYIEEKGNEIIKAIKQLDRNINKE